MHFCGIVPEITSYTHTKMLFNSMIVSVAKVSFMAKTYFSHVFNFGPSSHINLLRSTEKPQLSNK